MKRFDDPRVANLYGHEDGVKYPGIDDEEYQARVGTIKQAGMDYLDAATAGQTPEIPRWKYTDRENGSWATIWQELRELHIQHASAAHLTGFVQLQVRTSEIPQLADLSARLRTLTGFSLAPVGGLLDARIFLGNMAADTSVADSRLGIDLGGSTMMSTQYIRHHKSLLFTPEPDVVHEVQHAIQLTVAEVVRLVRMIGHAALNASQELMDAINKLYWFGHEFVLIREKDEVKIAGPGILGSIEETKRVVAAVNGQIDVPVKTFDPEAIAAVDYKYTGLQKEYWIADSLEQVNEGVRWYLESWDVDLSSVPSA